MIFLELVLQNFGPYLGRQTINLRPEIDSNTRPIILLGGMNGGGKTTLMDAIRLALYGNRAQCSTRGNLSYSDFLTQSVNQNASPIAQTRVELLFEHIFDGRQIQLRIVRSWTKNPKDGKDTLGILEDDWPEKALANIWDEYIENILPLGISNLFLFDGEQVKELAELEAPPPGVVEAIQSLLGLELAERLAVDLDILVSRKRKALASAKELANIEEIEQKLKELNQKYEAAKQKQTELQINLDRAHKNQQDAFEKFISEGGKIAAERSKLESEVRQLNNTAEASREALRDLAAGVLPLGMISSILKQAQTQAQKELKRQQAEIASSILKERDQRLLEYVTQLYIEDAQIQEIKAFLEQENQELEQETKNQEQPWLEADGEIINQLDSLLNHQLPSQSNLAAEQLDKLKHIEADIISTERQLANAASPESFQSLENNLKQAQKSVSEARIAYDSGHKQQEQLEVAIARTKKELEQYGEQAIDRKNNEHIINSAAKVHKTLKLFKEKLTLKKLNKLEVEVTECFRYLLHKSDLVHRVAIDTSSFSLSLYNPNGQPVAKHRLSAGEKQLLAIAFLWGLARVSGRHLPVAIDTPLGRLDSSHRNNLVERYFPTASHQVILLSTDTEIGEMEITQLRELQAIAREYLLEYNWSDRQTVVKPGYFF